MNTLPFDIFCRVVDNYGDAGVCWRLARQLAERGYPTRLWIDALDTLARLVPQVDTQAPIQDVHGVTVGTWQQAMQACPPRGGVVIEAFACTLPSAYGDAMKSQGCLWINLEYLSAEPWVESCHGLPSPQANGVPKYFFFPGFTAQTGGLLRGVEMHGEAATGWPDTASAPHLPASSPNRATTATEHARAIRPADRRDQLARMTGLPPDAFLTTGRHVLMFCYSDAPLAGLQAALAEQSTPTCLLVPGHCPPGLHSQGNLHVQPIPFVPQSDFDALLGCCDLNFVRGEDSLVRAIWAARPLVWQIYRQADDTHLDKLDAWLARAQWPATAQALTQAWNRQDNEGTYHALRRVLMPEAWGAWQMRSQAWATTLAQGPDLLSNLLAFCQKHAQTG